VIHSPQHHPFVGRDWVAEILDIPYEKVRFICPSMGGNFGMRGDFLHSGSAALLSYKTGKPVKIVFSREESLLGSSKSHSFVLKYKTGVDKNGKIIAFEAEIIGDGGCWIHHPGPNESRLSTIAGIAELVPGPFNVSNARIKVYEVCTNRPRSIPMRGTNMPQLAFAWDSQMDQIAKKLNIDPLALRLLNAVDSGSKMINGAILDESVGTKATLNAIKKPYEQAILRAKDVELPDNWKRGVGISTLWQVNGGGRGEGGGGGWHGRKLGPAKAAVELTEEGTVRVLVGAVEKGQGVITALAQIAAEELKLPLTSISMIYGDTLLAPYPVGTSGQRTSMHVGGAITKACEGLLAAVSEMASKLLGNHQIDIVSISGQVFNHRKPEEKLSLGSIATYMKKYNIPLKYEGSFVLEKTETEQGPIYAYASQVSEIDINVETGQVKLRNVTYAADIGRVINPLSFEGQVEGGVVMGMSYALKEHYKPGQTSSLKEYGLPDIRETPDTIKTIIVENPVVGGPFGSKGGAEMPVSPGAASISNAICNATGARVFDLPMTPDKVLEALKSNLY
jgi:CO/xanthine dehydrogenase Mo-binding subunit